MRISESNRLFAFCSLFAVTSLIHFVHNAEYLHEYPGLPHSWTRAGVYWSWLGLTVFGIVGLLLATRGPRRIGLVWLGIYALLGMDSLGHYVLAPVGDHHAGMNATILLEVGSAALLLVEVAKQLFGRRMPVERATGRSTEQVS